MLTLNNGSMPAQTRPYGGSILEILASFAVWRFNLTSFIPGCGERLALRQDGLQTIPLAVYPEVL